MSGLFYYDDDEFAAEGYPYFDQDRLRRSPYEERTFRDMDRNNDPFANPHMTDHRGRRSHRGEDPPPLLTLTASPRELERGMQRRSVAPEERRGPFDQILRGSETPPPRLRATRKRVDSFENMFGDLERPVRGSGEQFDRGAMGPSRDPFRRYEDSSSHRPYGGGPAPNDPFRPGGNLYNYERRRGHRHRSLEPPDLTDSDDQARRRDNHYRSRIGEPWGLAEFKGYEGRRRHEERVLREREREERRRRPRRREMEEDDDEYESEGNRFGGDFTLFDV